MEALSPISEASLAALRTAIDGWMTGRRLAHTLGVEKEIVALGRLYLPQNIPELRAAALLHDLTKEKTTAEQLSLCERYHIALTEADRLSPRILHAKTAPPVICERFAPFATPAVLDAIEKHTTGAREMTVFAKLLYLADYIEETRTFPDCVALRRAFWDGVADLPEADRMLHLNRVLIRSFDMTIVSLIEEGNVISPATVDARNALIEEISMHNS
jgi:nicotinate-nucleotide adenylyltransferase